MSVIELTGDLGPMDALTLRRELDLATAQIRPQIVLDLSAVASLHPAVVAAIVRASRRARKAAGSLRLVAPTSPSAERTIGLVSLPDLLA
ncbi:MAG: anti-anti-sigma factor [Paracrocinitomix sp.]|jgi:anti-anti-sigma factor